MAYHIWTDTSANLPAALCRELGIGVLPFHFIHNGGAEECCLDTDAFPYDEYYTDLKNGGVASTSMINSQAYGEIFEKEAAAGNDVLYVGMSSGISGAYLFVLNDHSFLYLRTWYNLRMIRSMSVDKNGLITDTGNVNLLQILKDKGVKLTHQFTPGIYEFG